MDLTLPDNNLHGKIDPRFATAVNHARVAKFAAHLTVGATVALGSELIRLRETIQPRQGGNRKSTSTTLTVPFRELVTEQTGFSYEYSRRAEKVAADLLARLSPRRDKEAIAAKALLKHPGDFTPDDYALLAKVTGEAYDADTFNGILIELGIVRRPVTNPGGNTEPPKALPLKEEARLFATGFLKTLRTAFGHGEKVRQRLAALPLQPTGDPDHPSLTELKSELETRLVEVKAIIERKMN